MHFAVEQLVVQYNNVSVTSTTGEHPFEGNTVLLCNFNSAALLVMNHRSGILVHVDRTPKNRHHHKLYNGCMCGLLLALLVVLLMVVTTLGVLSGVPRVNQDPSTIRPLFAYGSTLTPPLVVDFGTDPFWITKVDFQVEDCNGAVLKTEGRECLDLPVSINKNSDSLFQINYLYSLPGSIINITLLDIAANSGLEIWRLNSEAWLQSDLGKNLGSCDTPPPGSDCFFAQGLAGQSIQQVIEKADYYFFFANDSLSNAVQFTYAARQYNLTAIRQLNNPAETTITQDLSHTVTISNAFDFRQRKCILLVLSCSGVQMHRIRISGVKRRMDILIIPGVFGIFVVLVVISVISVCIIRIVWPKLKKS